MTSGKCLCGEIRYEVHGPLRDAIICHCTDCQRWHGSSPHMVSARQADVRITGRPSWYQWDDKPRRGFCAQCGSSLFWDAPERDSITIAAGTLDQPTGLSTKGRIFTAHAADYEVIPDDGLPSHEYGAPSALAAAPPRTDTPPPADTSPPAGDPASP